MSNFVFNVSKGYQKNYFSLPLANDALIAVLLKAGQQTDSTLADYTNLATLLGSNPECDFTNYARQTLTSVTSTVDNTNDRWGGGSANITYTNAGGAFNNTTGKLLVVYDPDTTTGTDSTVIPVLAFDAAFTTDGTTVQVTVNAAGLTRAQ